MKLENTRVFQTLSENERAFWLQQSCKTCFFFRAKLKDGETYCTNLKNKKKLKVGRYGLKTTPDDKACKRYMNDIVGRQRQLDKLK